MYSHKLDFTSTELNSFKKPIIREESVKIDSNLLVIRCQTSKSVGKEPT